MFDFKNLMMKDRAFLPVHEPAVQKVYERCRAKDPDVWTYEFMRAAVDVLRPAKIPLSPAIGQGLLESGFGSSTKSLFGIKARESDVAKGLANACPTREFINGKWISVTAYFFKDASMNAEFEHYLDLMRRVHPAFAKFYPARNEDYMNYICGEKAYATDPAYKQKVIKLVHDLGLEIFDSFEMYG